MEFIPLLMFFGGFFSIMIAMGQLFYRKKALISYIYAFSFLGLGLWIFQVSLYSTDLLHRFHFLALYIIPVSFLAAPLMSLRYRWVIVNRFRADRSFVLLAFPALVSVIILGVPLFCDDITWQPQYMEYMPVFSSSFRELPLYFKIVHLLYPLPKLYLVVAMIPTLVQMSVIWKEQPPRKSLQAQHSLMVSRMGYVFAIGIITSTALMALGDFISRELVHWSVIMANATLCSVYVATQRHPDFNRLLKIETRRAHYEQSKIKGINVEKILSRLHEIMDAEKAFADEELSIKVLADDLDVTVHQLSEILNEKLKKNFNSFVNEYRVKEAKKMLLEEPDRSVLSIGVAVGFNSNTTFSTVFSRIAGCSPGAYRKKKLSMETEGS